jgi:DNA repair exonuclease SbcCD ATPase subunit
MDVLMADNDVLKAQLKYLCGQVQTLERYLSMTRLTCDLMQQEEDRVKILNADLTVENMDLREKIDNDNKKIDNDNKKIDDDNKKKTINKLENQNKELTRRVEKLTNTNKELINENKALQAKLELTSANASAKEKDKKTKQLETLVIEYMTKIQVLVDQLKETRRENYVMASHLSIAEAYMRAHERSGHICGVNNVEKKSE